MFIDTYIYILHFFYRIVLEMFFYFQVPAAHVENGLNHLSGLPPGVNLNFIRNIYQTDNKTLLVFKTLCFNVALCLV